MARSSIDLHGRRREEVVPLIDRFILDAVEAELKQVRIVTGKGTGAVKAEVIAYLKQARYPWKHEKLANGKDNEGVLVVFVTD
jgi:DNA mismatch repair protein MutS2